MAVGESASPPGSVLLTVGHGRLDEEELGGLLRGAGVELLVDVRRFPGSRVNPAVARDVLPEWLPRVGIEYAWEERLGGRRKLPDPDGQDPWWRVDAFRGYAAHTRSEEFRAALEAVLAQARARRVAVMCSESVWWRCHRRLVADVATLAHGFVVRHLMPDGRLAEHLPADGARLDGDDVRWDLTGPT